jgi:putative FmdB family regulatory protein
MGTKADYASLRGSVAGCAFLRVIPRSSTGLWAEIEVERLVSSLRLGKSASGRFHVKHGASPSLRIVVIRASLRWGRRPVFGGATTMAVYEFECETCGNRFETVTPITQHDRLKEQPPACPQCKGTKTRQLVSHFNCTISRG